MPQSGLVSVFDSEFQWGGGESSGCRPLAPTVFLSFCAAKTLLPSPRWRDPKRNRPCVACQLGRPEDRMWATSEGKVTAAWDCTDAFDRKLREIIEHAELQSKRTRRAGPLSG